MAFEDLREKIVSQAKASWENFQETTIYNKAKDRFENLSPMMQKVTLSVIAFIVVLIIFSIPLGFYSASQESMISFETKRDLTRELLRAARETTGVPVLSGTPEVGNLQNQVQASLQGAQLLPEQIRGVAVVTLPASIIPQNLISYGLEVSLSKINLSQVVSLGHQLSQIDMMTTKVKDVEITPHNADPRYMDVIFRLVTFKVPQYQPLFPPPAPNNNPRGRPSRNRPAEGEETR